MAQLLIGSMPLIWRVMGLGRQMLAESGGHDLPREGKNAAMLVGTRSREIMMRWRHRILGAGKATLLGGLGGGAIGGRHHVSQSHEQVARMASSLRRNGSVRIE
jgi:hypothetical protein